MNTNRRHVQKDLVAALEEALELFAYEFCYSDGRVIEAHGGPSAGGAWVKQARAAIEATKRRKAAQAGSAAE